MLDINFNQIIEMIEKRKNNAYRKVNEEMILLYLEVGKFLYELKENSNYGDKITTKASDFMKNNYPNIKGFTKRNIERMIQFYSTYKDNEFSEKNLKNAISFCRALNTAYVMYFMLKTKVSQGLEVHFTLDLHSSDIILIQIKVFFIC